MEPLHDDIEERLTNLEVKACFSEDTVELLNQVIIRQQHQIDNLVRAMDDLRAQLSTAVGGGARLLQDELPPHY
jgi:SlyX protein